MASKSDFPKDSMNKGMVRRDLLGVGALVAAGLTAALPAAAQTGGAVAPQSTAAVPGRRRLGNLEVAPIGLGCMNMVAGFYNPAPDPKEMVSVIRGAVERGVTLIDTAEVYGPFASEEIVGAALEPIRDQVVLASKFGFGFQDARATGRNSQPAHIKEAVEGMLRRLRTDRIDLLYLHRMDPDVPVEDIAGAVSDLIKEGKARAFGMSEVAPATIRRAHAVQPVAAIQSEYSLLERLPEVAVLDLCAELGIGFVPWGPTGRALLTDNLNEFSRFDPVDRRAQVPLFTPEALEANMAVVRLAREWADRKGASPVQFALAWLLAERPFIVPIPGSTKLHHVVENLGALNVQISPEELQQFRTQLGQIKVVGARSAEEATRDA
ncbi:aldo/keto reductase [Rhizobium laguerreae]|uniref:aldo/keto reductase n=1 Tax=Rhizobium laguerreae TaxID=1076926 RepID=UPI001FE9C685|nr:aldo/keto reductase [Rhizobium laguerreae]MBY3416332.1 aldo/keto reductase [Rhizobium laguerreae]